MGREFLESFNIGTVGQDPVFEADRMTRVRIASDMPDAVRPTVQVLDTTSDAFAHWIETQTYDDICDVEIPTRVVN
jgi:peptidylprolyl isomerase